MRHLYLCTLSLLGLLFSLEICAQEVFSEKKSSPDTTVIASNDTIASVPLIRNEIVSRDNVVIDSLMTLIRQRDSVTMVQNTKIDSLRRILSVKDAEINRLTKERAFVDTCMARLANRWLYEKYNEKDVNSAIEYFNKILSTQLRRDRSIILELLKNYKSAYWDFQSILVSAQQDPDRTDVFCVPEYKEKYLSRIKSMSYYRQYYNESWNIRYLNERIKMSIDRLNAHSDEKPADFSDLID